MNGFVITEVESCTKAYNKVSNYTLTLTSGDLTSDESKNLLGGARSILLLKMKSELNGNSKLRCLQCPCFVQWDIILITIRSHIYCILIYKEARYQEQFCSTAAFSPLRLYHTYLIFVHRISISVNEIQTSIFIEQAQRTIIHKKIFSTHVQCAAQYLERGYKCSPFRINVIFKKFGA